MLLSVLLLLLLVCGTQAGFHGFVFTYTVKATQGTGYMVVVIGRFSFSSCGEFDTWFCSSCTNAIIYKTENVGEWCQNQVIWSRPLTSLNSFSGGSYGNNWVPNINAITQFKCVDYEEMRNRSDIGKPNTSPQTTILPAVRVPSNCQSNISLLNFDPNGDVVKCRYADGSLPECFTCTPPSVLSLSSSSCILSFSPTSSSNEGSYAVQMMMEDFPRQTINLTDDNGVKVVKTTSDSITRTNIEFVLKVVPAVPSCSEGLYLPRFLPPTPENRAHLNTSVNQIVIITITAEANQSVITGLLFSGPHNMVKNTSGPGNFTLTWTPNESQDYESHPICFVVQATYSSSVYHSEHRCLIVTVKPPPPLTPHVYYLKMKLTTALSLENNKELIEKAIKDKVISRGIPPAIRVKLLSSVTTTAPPSG